MLAQARPLWSALPEGALQRQLLGELAGKANLPLDDLNALWNDRRRPRAAPARGDAARRRAAATTATRRADAPRRGGRRAPGDGQWRRARPTAAAASAAGRSTRSAPRATARRPSCAAMRRMPRSAPKTPESRAVQMLFGHPEYWDQLSTDEHELLHALPAPVRPAGGLAGARPLRARPAALGRAQPRAARRSRRSARRRWPSPTATPTPTRPSPTSAAPST